MRFLRALLAGTAIGAALALSALAPASASTTLTDRLPVQVWPLEDISGTPWSSPAYPVGCRTSSGQVTCTPADSTKVTAQRCFIGVIAGGTSTTVCTTYEGHVGAIQSSGGRELLVKYGCSLGDVVCLTFENAGRGLALAATGMMFVVAENMRFDTSTLLWTAAVGEWSFWQWGILIITFGAMVWAVAAAVVSGDRDELVGALVRSFLAIPAVPISLWLTGHVLNAVDDMTWYIMNRDGPLGLFSTLQSVMWAGGQANYFFAFVIHALLMIGMLLLMLVFAFRNIVLAALIAVGPVAWMMFPLRGIGPQWVVRYVSAVVVLLLTGPLTIGFTVLIINGLANVKTIWDPQSWPLLIGLILVAFAPFAIFGLFSFVGAAAADGVGSRLGSRGSQMAGNAARSVSRIPSRVGGLPSGVSTGASATGGRVAAAKMLTPAGSNTAADGPSKPATSQATPPRGPAAPAQSPGASAKTTGVSPPAQASPPQPPSAPAGASPDRKTS